jgi:hypothetical protein
MKASKQRDRPSLAPVGGKEAEVVQKRDALDIEPGPFATDELKEARAEKSTWRKSAPDRVGNIDAEVFQSAASPSARSAGIGARSGREAAQ